MAANITSSNIKVYQKKKHLNIGIVIFGVIFIYLLVTVLMYLTAKHISVYEVREGSIVKDTSYTGLAIRNETVVHSKGKGYVNYFISEGNKVGAKTQVYSLSDQKLQFETNTNNTQKLTSSEQSAISQKTQTFCENYTDGTFGDVYTLKNNISGVLEGKSNQNRQTQIAALTESDLDGLKVYTAESDGIISYSVDGFENTKAMVLNRDNYTCQYCKGKHKDSKLEVHHIIFRSQGGSDEDSNLITLCHTCHKNLHDGKIAPNFKGKAKGTLKYATQMNSIRKQLFRLYPEVIETFGYVTKANRLAIGIEKEHYYDACTIATQGKPFIVKTNFYKKKCVSDGDFQKTKGIRSEQPIVTDKIYGFRKFDKVKYFGKEYFIKGRMSTGYAILMDIEGNKVDFLTMPKGFKTPKMINLKRLEARSSWMVTTVEVTPNIV